MVTARWKTRREGVRYIVYKNKVYTMKFKFKRHVCNVSLHSTGSLSTIVQVFRNAAPPTDRNYPRVQRGPSFSLVASRVSVQGKCLRSGLVSVSRTSRKTCCTRELSFVMYSLGKNNYFTAENAAPAATGTTFFN